MQFPNKSTWGKCYPTFSHTSPISMQTFEHIQTHLLLACCVQFLVIKCKAKLLRTLWKLAEVMLLLRTTE